MVAQSLVGVAGAASVVIHSHEDVKRFETAYVMAQPLEWMAGAASVVLHLR